MILVFGGAYQGKLDFVKKEFFKTEQDIHHCKTTVDFEKDVLDGFEQYLLEMIRQGKVPSKEISEHLQEFEEKIIVIQDISCGIVPMEQELRLWREEVGRVMVLLSRVADQVYRVYCGIPTKLK